jgi:hypothetical protein
MIGTLFGQKSENLSLVPVRIQYKGKEAIIHTSEQEAVILEGFMRAINYRDAALLSRDLVEDLENSLEEERQKTSELKKSHGELVDAFASLLSQNDKLTKDNLKLEKKVARGNRKGVVGFLLGALAVLTIYQNI